MNGPFNTRASQKLVRTAIKAAQAAGKILEAGHRRVVSFSIREKPHAGLVTSIDLASEKAAMKVLRAETPSFEILTEESGHLKGKGKSAPARWILDPVDGTTNFVHGFPMFCVSLGLELEGELVAGVVFNPILKELYVGAKKQGATCNGKRMQVSRTRTISQALLTTGFSYTRGRGLNREIHLFHSVSQKARAIRRPGSAALDLAYTARGVFDGYWERNLKPWDIAAGVVLVREAGGKVSNITRPSFDVDYPEIIASNSALHSKLQSIVRL